MSEQQTNTCYCGEYGGGVHTKSVRCEQRSSNEHCAWIPEFTGGQVSKIFHLTNCGVTGVATIASGNWKFCPHCGRKVIFRTWREIYEGMAEK